MNVTGIHHLTLTVSNAEASAEWYQRLLGPASLTRRQGSGWSRVRMQWAQGLIIGATQHDATVPGDRFDHGRVGLDHLGLGCRDEAEVRAWADRIDELDLNPVWVGPAGQGVQVLDAVIIGVAEAVSCALPA